MVCRAKGGGSVSRKSDKIQRALEANGHTDVSVWWEALTPALEMCDCGGGFMFSSNQERYPVALGTSFGMALENTRFYKQKEAAHE